MGWYCEKCPVPCKALFQFLLEQTSCTFYSYQQRIMKVQDHFDMLLSGLQQGLCFQTPTEGGFLSRESVLLTAMELPQQGCSAERQSFLFIIMGTYYSKDAVWKVLFWKQRLNSSYMWTRKRSTASTAHHRTAYAENSENVKSHHRLCKECCSRDTKISSSTGSLCLLYVNKVIQLCR